MEKDEKIKELEKEIERLKEEHNKAIQMMKDEIIKKFNTILDNTKKDGVFVSTGYFDPDAKAIRLFVNGRGYKDILRTLAHEFIHRKQDEDGVIEKSGYQGDKITEDKALVKLEAEAYLKGNLAFRSWTEEESKKGNLK